MAYSSQILYCPRGYEKGPPDMTTSSSAGFRRSTAKHLSRVHKPVYSCHGMGLNRSLKPLSTKALQQRLRLRGSSDDRAAAAVIMSHEKSGRHASENSFHNFTHEGAGNGTTTDADRFSAKFRQPTSPLGQEKRDSSKSYFFTATSRGLISSTNAEPNHNSTSRPEADTDSDSNISSLADDESVFSDTSSINSDITELDLYMSSSDISEPGSMDADVDADEDALEAAERATLARIEATLASAHHVQELTRPWVEMGVVLAAAAQNPRAREMTVAQLYEQLGKVGTSRALEIMAGPVMETPQRMGNDENDSNAMKASRAVVLMTGNSPGGSLAATDSADGETSELGEGVDDQAKQLV